MRERERERERERGYSSYKLGNDNNNVVAIFTVEAVPFRGGMSLGLGGREIKGEIMMMPLRKLVVWTE